MPITHEPNGRGPYGLTNPKAWINVTAKDIPPGWIDNMVKRLFDEANRQLIRLERASSQLSDKKDHDNSFPDHPERRATDAHTLSTIVRLVDKLIGLETGRSQIRATKAVRKPKDVRKALAKQLFSGPGQTTKKAPPAGAE
jgi:hypothetical protein